MTPRVVCDTMVFYQWVTLPGGRQHGLHKAVLEDQVRLCLSSELLTEIRDVLARPNIRAKAPSLTDERVNAFLDAILDKSHLEPQPSKDFTLPLHPDDDHVFNLAIAAQATRLVTWEDRLLNLATYDANAARRLTQLAPWLRILTPREFVEELRRERAADPSDPDADAT